MKKLSIILAAIVALAACGQNGQKKGAPQKLPSGGAPYEVLVVVEDLDWDGGLGDSIRAALSAPVPMINSYEPQFDMIRIMPDRFNGAMRRQGSVIAVDIDGKYEKPGFKFATDEYAQPQIVVHAVGPDAKGLAVYVHEHGAALRAALNGAERRRWNLAAGRNGETQLEERVAEKIGLKVSVPKGFVRDQPTDSIPDFAWAIFNYPESTQTLTFYSYAATGDDLTPEKMMDARDGFVKNIPGSLPGSHMITVREIVEPVVERVTIGGREWVEMRGLWELDGDVMGGSFVSYSTFDEATGRIVVIDGAVYSPSPYKPKRNLLRQLESIVHSATIVAPTAK